MYKQLIAALIVATATTPLTVVAGNGDKPHLQPASYCVHDLGRLPNLPANETFVLVAAINNLNQVVGTITNAGRSQAFIWQRAHMRALGVLPGQLTSSAQGINDAGRVVGFSSNSEGETVTERSFIWDRRNGMRELNASLGGDRHQAADINRFGQIVGSSNTAANTAQHAFFRDLDGEVFDLGTFPGGNPETVATAVNDFGQVTGLDFGPQFSAAFIWDKRNGLQRLIEPGSRLSIFPHDINNRREIVGAILFEGTRAFRWTKRDGLQDLGSLGGADTDFVEAFGINERGTIVGVSQVAGGAARAFILSKRSGMRDLNELIDATSPLAPHVVLTVAKAINDLGWIAVEGRDLRNPTSDFGFLLAPRLRPGSPRCRA